MARYKYAVDRMEMERRHRKTLAEMESRGIDCIVLQANTSLLGGAFQYLTDMPVASYGLHALFSKHGLVLYGHGARTAPVKARHIDIYNVKEEHAYPMVVSMAYADEWAPLDMVDYIRKHGFKKIGLVGMGYITANVYKCLTENLTGCEFVNASVMMNRIRAEKSEYEIELYKNCVAIHDELIGMIPNILAPGKTECEVKNAIAIRALELDCPMTNIMIGSHPTHPTPNPEMYMNKIIEETDSVMILVEVCCPYYTWGEVGRNYMFKEPSQEVKEAAEYCIWLQDHIMSLCVPGAKPAELFAYFNAKLEEAGFNREQRVAIHSQSCDLVESPCFHEDETMTIEENMYLACHPTCVNDRLRVYSCDNFLVTAKGGERLNKTPRGLVVL